MMCWVESADVACCNDGGVGMMCWVESADVAC